jgi:Protein of unknown function (DUF4019)
MKRLLESLVIVALLTPSFPAAAQNVPDAAPKAAMTWLHLIDQGRYAESWTTASTRFKAAVTEQTWQHALEQTRAPLGTLEKRTRQRMTFATSVPGAPDGQYVIMQFHTTFSHKASATETVTCMLDTDGAWRVAGYFIR